MTKFFLLIIIIAHIFILSRLIFFPYPELFIYPYLTNHGLKPYSQILDQHFPGLMFLPVNFDNLGMNDATSARLWLYAIVAITHVLLFLISKKILGEKKAFLANFLYLLWQPFFEGWVLWIDNFLPLMLLPAAYFLYRKNFIFSGLLIGVAVVFKQTIIPLSIMAFLYILLSEKNIKKTTGYLLGLILPVILMILYFIWIGVFPDFWYWTITFNLTVYASLGTQIPTSFGFISRVLMVYIASLSGFLYKEKRLKIIVFIFLVGSLIGAFDRANFVHFQPSLPFAVILTGLGVYSLTKRKTGFILIAIYLTVTIWWQNIFYKGHISNKVFFFDDSTYAISNKIRQYTKEGDKIFVFGAAPHLYQMSQTLPAGDIFVFQFPWFLSVAEDRILQGLEKDRPSIIIADKTVKIEGMPIADFAKKINSYINENYQKIDSTGSVDILKRK
ncbi:hypothetical protein A3B42_02335 [Candidatus Daviesbacteria bacterium RIFCSPLOWO2_01_FULL_38_10]|uniref:Glycosyltransferase RgtA/B/C/D-like domain-containing protein n=1 Tax=Candidatus Daviesbacteria bacterium GW2011_GWF2_38_6 TaxID=1618432 RepID=A0A0G0MZX7_9BACT|nr:MAG: hypothetical protein US80_C0002G0046 [Candidatus Daviesbacteria bacterium GW2011_GWA2_38_17]KKQ79159.1 MAG: hypothetical protein US99_C0001G0014 [Candidatus Daviesbacteria bacterium GW2011_GWF2_38_6]OGE27221.1 MAG: hypothetical protein A2772_02605 [Candidatus Daviesbacteria bacterium RIFCSPHIGHO2_01_FULL_38_8b]OGE37424.1 MAG: hypothetical protein A3B42_02335 [Candidatus Daviesbacteria bacterium RIFCSPLOWO2_01_FULL_38_10]OGE44594.1 MAG: hypothetical protein A3E67_02630 [Candidatus Davies